MWRDFLGKMLALLLVACLLVALVSSGGWKAVSQAIGIGDPGASSDLTSKEAGAAREPGAKGVTLPGAGKASASPQPTHTWVIGGSTPATSPTGGATSTPTTSPTGGATSTPTTSPTGGATSTPTTSPSPTISPTGKATGHADYGKALNSLDSITVAKPRIGGYDRERDFGGWADRSKTMCGKATTRDMILKRDLKPSVSNRDCQVTAGKLADPYTGRTIVFKRGRTTSAAVQIDHVVALLDAWGSGARDWTHAQRVAYANDPDVLLASDGPANMAKGAGLDFNGSGEYSSQGTGAPDVWMPTNKVYRCDYMAKRVAIKTKYRLTMTPREKQQTVKYLGACAAGKVG
jgi:hypothetical protein